MTVLRRAILGIMLCIFAACRTVPDGLIALSSLEIEGNKKLSDREIKKNLLLQPGSQTYLWGKQRYYDEMILRTDLDRIVRAYEAKGIFDTKASVKSVDIKNKTAKVVIKIEEGTQVKVATVEVRGFPEDLPKLSLKPGAPFSESSYEEDKNKLTSALTENGYPFATCTGKALVDPTRQEAQIVYTVQAGPRYRIGEITIAGADPGDEEPILDATRLKQGEWVRKSDIDRAKGFLSQLGAFSVVKIEFGKAGQGSSSLPLQITLTKGADQSLGVGFGVLAENSQQMIGGRFSYRHNNFYGGLRTFNVEIQPAYIFAPTFVERQSQGWGGRANITFLQPNALKKLGLEQLGSVTTLRAHRDFRIDYATEDFALRTGFVWPQYDLSNAEAGITIEPFSVRNAPPELPIGGCFTLCRLVFLDQKLVLDKRNPIVHPTRGWYARLSVAESLPASDFQYVSLMPELRAYFPLLEKLSIATRAEIGVLRSLTPGQQTPIIKRFLGGGPNQHRGFAYGELSPAIRSSENRWIKYGGNSSVLLSGELRYVPHKNILTATFLDVGDVTTDPLRLAFRNLNYAWGIGFGIDTPIAPFRVDLAYRLNNPPPYSERGLRRFAFHFVFGDSF